MDQYRYLIIIALILNLFSMLNARAESKRYIVEYKLRPGSSSSNPLSMGRYKVKHFTESEYLKTLNNPKVASIEEDLVLTHQDIPSDTLYEQQWGLNSNNYGISASDAWMQTFAIFDVVMAVVDTGIVNHSEFDGRLLDGADLISSPSVGNDGDGRDLDPFDDGDWVGPGDNCYQGFSSKNSWHGTHVTGILSANGNNGIGIAGVNWHSKVLPVRVLGKCGGFVSDIADGVRWAAGGIVEGLPINQNPAKVINLSLGGPGPCPNYMQEAINFAISQGSVVVVAAGNSDVSIDKFPFTPANCENVITVSSINNQGFKSSFSNFGKRVDIAAPGGEKDNGILSTYNSGTTSLGEDLYRELAGTSMAAPHVSGVVSLMFSANPALAPHQIKNILKSTAKTIGSCSKEICGSGLVDAGKAVELALNSDPEEIKPIESNLGEPPNGQHQFLQPVDESKAASCGSVSLGDSDGGGGGPAILSFFLGLFLMIVLKNKRALASAVPNRKPN